jgi:hypothetical protein
MDFLYSIEFYVTLFVIAAFAVALLALPAGHGPVETCFANGILSLDENLADPTPRLELECQEDGSVKITRYGLPDDLNSAATIALAINRKAFDIAIEERISPASRPLLDSELTPVNTATFYLQGLAHERYHIKYNSDATSSFTALTLMNRPGLRSTRIFREA